MNIILGITGSVSAYKTPWLVRDLRRDGHDVRVVITPSARAFVAPMALEATSLHHVIIDPFEPEIQEGGSWHVQLAQWADAMLIAPCSASTLSRLATGLADTALMMLVLSLPKKTPVVIAPAMDEDMWLHPSTQRNLQRVSDDGVIVIPPESGELSSGLSGIGRLPALTNIVEHLRNVTFTLPLHDSTHSQLGNGNQESEFRKNVKKNLQGKSILITAGPTHEPIDAVRSIVNHSTGAMGFALAEAARDRGMMVTLITGPVSLPTPRGIERVNVHTAADMMNAVKQHSEFDVAIMSAAVADYTPVGTETGKIKKKNAGSTWRIELKRTDDILLYLCEHKIDSQIIVGFALEYDNVIEYAREKLNSKKADLIIANQAGIPNSGFGMKFNTISIVMRPEDVKTMQPGVDADDSVVSYPAMSKRACAEVILDHISALMQTRTGKS